MKKISKITLRLVFSSVLLGILLCTVIVLSGYRQFSSKFRSLYENTLTSVSEAALSVIDPHRTEYYRLNEADERYEAVYKILDDMTQKFDLNFIYVSSVSGLHYQHIIYIYDTVNKNSDWTPYPKGYTEDFYEKEYNESAKTVYEKGTSVVRFVRKAKTGSHIMAMIPVKNDGGKVVAVLGVEKSTQEYINVMTNYLIKSILISITITFIVVLLLIYFSKKEIIHPLLAISQETFRFKKEQKVNEGWNNFISTKDEISDLAQNVAAMEKDIVNYVENITKITAEKERISTELNIARNIQAAMLPKEYPPFPDRKEFDISATMVPAKEVGGDLYDYLILDEDHLLMVVGDVSGKGIPASLFMAITKNLIQTKASESLSPAEIANKVNWTLCQKNEMSMFVTVWLGIWTISTGELKFVNAAHPFPVLYHQDSDSCEFLKTRPNLMFGAMDFTKYEEHSVTLKPGDRLFVYTDGVTEAMGDDQVLFGEERTIEAAKESLKSPLNAKESLNIVMDSINAFVKEAPQFDDITMLQFRVN